MKTFLFFLFFVFIPLDLLMAQSNQIIDLNEYYLASDEKKTEILEKLFSEINNNKIKRMEEIYSIIIPLLRDGLNSSNEKNRLLTLRLGFFSTIPIVVARQQGAPYENPFKEQVEIVNLLKNSMGHNNREIRMYSTALLSSAYADLPELKDLLVNQYYRENSDDNKLSIISNLNRTNYVSEDVEEVLRNALHSETNILYEEASKGIAKFKKKQDLERILELIVTLNEDQLLFSFPFQPIEALKSYGEMVKPYLSELEKKLNMMKRPGLSNQLYETIIYLRNLNETHVSSLEFPSTNPLSSKSTATEMVVDETITKKSPIDWLLIILIGLIILGVSFIAWRIVRK